MAIPKRLLGKRLAERRIQRKRLLKELTTAQVRSFDQGARVGHEYLGSCVIVKHETNGNTILSCDKNNKHYRVGSSTLVSPLPNTGGTPNTDLVFRPNPVAPQNKDRVDPNIGIKKSNPDFSKFSPKQIDQLLQMLGAQYERELVAGKHKAAKQTAERYRAVNQYKKQNVNALAEDSAAYLVHVSGKLNSPGFKTRLRTASGEFYQETNTGALFKFDNQADARLFCTGMRHYEKNAFCDEPQKLSTDETMKKTRNLSEDNNANYIYAQLCDIAMKMAAPTTEDIDLSKMTTGALQKHYIANQNNINQSPVFTAHMARIKRELRNRTHQMHEEEDEERSDSELSDIFAALKHSYDEVKKYSKLEETRLTLPELRTKQKQLQQMQMRTDLSDDQKSKLQRVKVTLYAHARESGLGDYIAEEMTLSDYRQRRRALQQIQLDPDSHKDPLLKKALASRLAKLNADATQAGLQIMEDPTQLEVGSPVVIVGDNQFSGMHGTIVTFSSDRRFVVVDLEQGGKHSFQSAEVEMNFADQEVIEDFAGAMTVLTRKLKGKPSVEELKRQHFDRAQRAKQQGDRETLNKETQRYLKVAALNNDAIDRKE